MAGEGRMTGNEYKKLVGRYLVSAYGPRGLAVYDEVHLGTSIIGKQRRIDLFVLGPDGAALCVECKYQDSSGTADEKIPYAINDMASQRIPGVIVYAGAGFSAGVLHLLQGSEYAAYCLPDETLKSTGRGNGPIGTGTWQLDHIVAQTFKFWDIILGKKKPIELTPAVLAAQAINSCGPVVAPPPDERGVSEHATPTVDTVQTNNPTQPIEPTLHEHATEVPRVAVARPPRAAKPARTRRPTPADLKPEVSRTRGTSPPAHAEEASENTPPAKGEPPAPTHAKQEGPSTSSGTQSPLEVFTLSPTSRR